jgi:hypothetical protein
MWLSWRQANGEGPAIPIGPKSTLPKFAVDWVETDRLLVLDFHGLTTPNFADILLMPLDRPEDGEAVIAGPHGELPWGLSNDGRYVLYQEVSEGGFRGYVAQVESGKRWQLWEGNTGLWSPALWRPDDGEIYYMRGNDLMARSVRLGNRPQFGEPRRLFTMRLGNHFQSTYFFYAVTGDGERFYFAVPASRREREETTAFEVVLNWHAELER